MNDSCLQALHCRETARLGQGPLACVELEARVLHCVQGGRDTGALDGPAQSHPVPRLHTVALSLAGLATPFTSHQVAPCLSYTLPC